MKLTCKPIFSSIKVLVLIACFQVNTIYSQMGKDQWSLTIDATLTSGVSSKLYKNYLNGLINTQPKLTYKFKNSLFLAAGVKYAYYTISEFKIPTKTTGGLHTYGGYLEFGFNQWKTEYFGIEAGVKVGYAEHQFITGLTRISGPQKVQAMYFMPCFSLILRADEATSWRWIFGYNVDCYQFKTVHIGIPNDNTYSTRDRKGPAESIVVGFGFTRHFGENKRTDVDID